MTQFTGFWLVFYQVMVLIGWAGSILFPLGYGLLMKWWKTEQGVHLFCYAVAIADAMTLISARLVFGDFPGRPVLTMFCLVSLVAVIWWRLLLWVRTYIQNRPDRKALGLSNLGTETRERHKNREG